MATVEIQFINAYNRSVRQQQSVTLKSPKAPRRLTSSRLDDNGKSRFNADDTPYGQRNIIVLRVMSMSFRGRISWLYHG